MNVIFSPEVEEYLFELSEILYRKEYFGFKEFAVQYVNDLLNDIKTTLPNRVKKPAPSYFDKYGKKILYSVFQKNKLTQWYVFFSTFHLSNCSFPEAISHVNHFAVIDAIKALIGLWGTQAPYTFDIGAELDIVEIHY